MLARVEAGFWISKSEVHALQQSSLQCPQVSEFSSQAGQAKPNCHARQAVVESFCIRADEEVQFVPSVFTSPVSSAGPLLYHHAPWLCQSPTWALPSFSISSSTLPWPTPSSNTCASWTLTPNPPPHATPASSAPSVGQHSCLPDQSSSPNRQAGAAAHRPASSLAPDLKMFNSRVVFLCVNLCRARLSLRGHAEGDDQVWNEHCPHELLPWNTWRELPHWSAKRWTDCSESRRTAWVWCRSRYGIQKTNVAICVISHHFMYFSGNVGKAFAAHCLITLKEHTLLQPALYVKKVKAIQHQWWNLSPNMRYIWDTYHTMLDWNLNTNTQSSLTGYRHHML